MKLRIARKIYKAMDTPRQSAYSECQLGRALDKIERTKEAKDSDRYWRNLMNFLGPLGRAELVFDLRIAAIGRGESP